MLPRVLQQQAALWRVRKYEPPDAPMSRYWPLVVQQPALLAAPEHAS